jgi:hypothetical protein
MWAWRSSRWRSVIASSSSSTANDDPDDTPPGKSKRPWDSGCSTALTSHTPFQRAQIPTIRERQAREQLLMGRRTESVDLTTEAIIPSTRSICPILSRGTPENQTQIENVDKPENNLRHQSPIRPEVDNSVENTPLWRTRRDPHVPSIRQPRCASLGASTRRCVASPLRRCAAAPLRRCAVAPLRRCPTAPMHRCGTCTSRNPHARRTADAAVGAAITLGRCRVPRHRASCGRRGGRDRRPRRPRAPPPDAAGRSWRAARRCVWPRDSCRGC